MDPIPVTIERKGKQYTGELTPVAGVGSTSVRLIIFITAN